ncbi:MAG TPA: polyamine aminopropyltransferase [Chlamydiales bacterium]|nr:polyamine aminopropyltransferase [Chlamydiales bacterium]
MFLRILLLLSATLYADRYLETLYPEWGQSFEMKTIIHQEKSDFWELSIFENPLCGRVLAIDGIIQTTEADEAIYHEMMAHVPLLAHGHAKSILIIGGGDGGLLREVLRHTTVQKAIVVEIDPSVIELSKKYLPSLSQGAFSDPRAQIVIQDAAKYIKETKDTFDVILCDSTDPTGPGKVLFTTEFYGDCKKKLKSKGIFVNQNGVPFFQKSELKLTQENRAPHYKNVRFYLAPVPTYVGGFLALGWASDTLYKVSEKTLQKRMKNVRGKMKYYTPAIHKAAFVLPQYVLDALN